MIDINKSKKNNIATTQISLSTNDEVKRLNKTKIKHESKIITQNYNKVLSNTKDEVRNKIEYSLFYLIKKCFLV